MVVRLCSWSFYLVTKVAILLTRPAQLKNEPMLCSAIIALNWLSQSTVSGYSYRSIRKSVHNIATRKQSMAKASRTALDEVSNKGEFQRKDAVWRNWISRDEGAPFPPEKDRYHL